MSDERAERDVKSIGDGVVSEKESPVTDFKRRNPSLCMTHA